MARGLTARPLASDRDAECGGLAPGPLTHSLVRPSGCERPANKAHSVRVARGLTARSLASDRDAECGGLAPGPPTHSLVRPSGCERPANKAHSVRVARGLTARSLLIATLNAGAWPPDPRHTHSCAPSGCERRTDQAHLVRQARALTARSLLIATVNAGAWPPDPQTRIQSRDSFKAFASVGSASSNWSGSTMLACADGGEAQGRRLRVVRTPSDRRPATSRNFRRPARGRRW